MSQNIALDALIEKREKLIADKTALVERLDGEINQVETAIENLSGKQVWEVVGEERFMDTHPDYIRSSQEEI